MFVREVYLPTDIHLENLFELIDLSIRGRGISKFYGAVIKYVKKSPFRAKLRGH